MSDETRIGHGFNRPGDDERSIEFYRLQHAVAGTTIAELEAQLAEALSREPKVQGRAIAAACEEMSALKAKLAEVERERDALQEELNDHDTAMSDVCCEFPAYVDANSWDEEDDPTGSFADPFSGFELLHAAASDLKATGKERDQLKVENERLKMRPVIPCPNDLEEHRKADYHQGDENCPAGVRRLTRAATECDRLKVRLDLCDRDSLEMADECIALKAERYEARKELPDIIHIAALQMNADKVEECDRLRAVVDYVDRHHPCVACGRNQGDKHWKGCIVGEALDTHQKEDTSA